MLISTRPGNAGEILTSGRRQLPPVASGAVSNCFDPFLAAILKPAHQALGGALTANHRTFPKVLLGGPSLLIA